MKTGSRSRARCFSMLALTVAGIMCIPGESGAQDAHYWTEQYGPRASLLGGEEEGFSARYVYSRFRLLFGFEAGVG